jgi:hypothetical protein
MMTGGSMNLELGTGIHWHFQLIECRSRLPVNFFASESESQQPDSEGPGRARGASLHHMLLSIVTVTITKY